MKITLVNRVYEKLDRAVFMQKMIRLSKRHGERMWPELLYRIASWMELVMRKRLFPIIRHRYTATGSLDDLRTLQRQIESGIGMLEQGLKPMSESERIEHASRFGSGAFIIGDFVIARAREAR